jgi:hypothetical protein
MTQTHGGSRQPGESATRIVGAYLLLAMAPFVFAATHSWFWSHQHYRAPVSAALFAILLIALLLRQRWAWFVLVVFNGFFVVSCVWNWPGAPAFVITLASFALLVSRPMRRYIHRE